MKKDIIETIVVLLISIAIGVVIRVYVIDVVKVHGPSMENTIQDGDKLVLLKKAEPNHGDIVVVHMDGSKNIIKRVVGLPGDEIEIRKHELYRNGEKIKEPYIKESMELEEMEKVKVEEGTVYLMGDNRNVSADSRMYGAFSMEEYRGKVWLEVGTEWKFY